MSFHRHALYGVTAVFSLAIICASPIAISATNLNDPTAAVVNVKKACGSTANCAESFSDLVTWLWTTRNPDVSAPLSIQVDPGDFEIPKNTHYCDGENNPGRGHIALTGAGRDVTILRGPSGRGSKIALRIRDCSALTFSNLAIKSDGGEAVKWQGGGISTWNNVDLESLGAPYVWVDDPSTSAQCGVHYWFSSRLTQFSPLGYSAVYRSNCGEAWFYGSDIAALSNDGGASSALGVYVKGLNNSARIFGSTVRAIVLPGSAGSNTQPNPASVTEIVGGLFADAGQIHMHGGIISVQALGIGNVHVFSTKARQGGTIHTPETAFTLIPSGTGTAARILEDTAAKIDAPYTWPSGSTPPNIISISGADSFIETDCDSTGDCDTPQGAARPHTLVYDATCTATLPWFDMATNKCRGE